MRVTLIHNTKSGDAGADADSLLHWLRRADMDPTACDARAEELDEVLAAPAELIVVAGGDGTVGRMLGRLPDRGVPVAILPLGTANNIARTLGIAGEPERLIAGLRDADRRQFGFWRADGPWGRRCMVEGLGVGAVAAAMREGHKRPSPGKERAGTARAALRQAIAAGTAGEVRLTLDGSEHVVRALLVEALNTEFIDSGLRLAPAADPGDGWLDVVIVEEDQRALVLDWLEAPDRPLPLEGRRARELSLEWEGAPVHVDDELPEPGRGVTRVMPEPQSLTVLVPRRAGR